MISIFVGIGAWTLKWCECPIIALRGQPAGSCVPMVLNYSHCVVLGTEPAYLWTA